MAEVSPTTPVSRASHTKGEVKVWLTAAGLAVGLIMIVGLLLLIAVNGIGVFWPHAVSEFTLRQPDGSTAKIAGAVVKTQERRSSDGGLIKEIQIFTGNKDAYSLGFRYLDVEQIVEQTQPTDLYVAERHSYGDSVFRPVRLELGGRQIVGDAPEFEAEFRQAVNQQNRAEGTLVYRLSSGEERSQKLGEVVAFYRPNVLSLLGKFGIFTKNLWQFLSEQPRESNTEGGIFPAIFGTVVMTLLMAILVTPLGVIAAIYMREYARQGLLVQIVRICVNNLAGVPSIVFGVFGLGFFIYGVGGFIDRGVTQPMPAPLWFLTAFGAIVCLPLAITLSTRGRPGAPAQIAGRSVGRFTEPALWVIGVVLLVVAVATCPYFHGFFNKTVGTPTFGTGGILWASLTLALMTLPVVIVATEEALVAVPRGVREAALACGASKWQMIQRVVLPGALPGVMTGVILAMARGAGEVAPLMITGVVKLAPSLPLDGSWPFVHAERKFMHLGFHIFDLGFQSPDSEGAKPMVFATTLLLIFIVVVLNLTAIQIRTHLRRRYQASAF